MKREGSANMGENPYLEKYEQVMGAYPEDMKRLVDPDLEGGDIRRAILFDMLPDPDITELYAWAVPDERALRIIAHFGPVVEIACGSAYWGRMLLDRGVDWVGFDVRGGDSKKRGGKEPWAPVRRGGPEVLRQESVSKGRALLLCYPDEFVHDMRSVALRALDDYSGDTIVHIGEMMPHTQLENPWGKTTASDFQLELSHGWHKVVQVPLPSWPVSVDCLSVWKRSRRTQVDDMQIRYIPPEERLCLVQCSESTRHLVKQRGSETTTKGSTVSRRDKKRKNRDRAAESSGSNASARVDKRAKSEASVDEQDPLVAAFAEA